MNFAFRILTAFLVMTALSMAFLCQMHGDNARKVYEPKNQAEIKVNFGPYETAEKKEN